MPDGDATTQPADRPLNQGRVSGSQLLMSIDRLVQACHQCSCVSDRIRCGICNPPCQLTVKSAPGGFVPINYTFISLFPIIALLSSRPCVVAVYFLLSIHIIYLSYLSRFSQETEFDYHYATICTVCIDQFV